MCDRTCPNCKSTSHGQMSYITGTYLACDNCLTVLAFRFDEEAAPIDCADPEAYAKERSFVLEGAEAKDPEDDRIYLR